MLEKCVCSGGQRGVASASDWRNQCWQMHVDVCAGVRAKLGCFTGGWYAGGCELNPKTLLFVSVSCRLDSPTGRRKNSHIEHHVWRPTHGRFTQLSSTNQRYETTSWFCLTTRLISYTTSCLKTIWETDDF